MPKFDSKEEYLKWKGEKSSQDGSKPIFEKGQPSVDNSVNNNRRLSVKAVYIFPLILFVLAILYFAVKSFDYDRNPSLSHSGNHKEAKFDEILSKPERESSLTPVEKVGSENFKPGQKSSAPTMAEKEEPEITKIEPEASPSKLTISEIVKQARKAVVTIKTSKGHGSGFFISSDGKIVTNTHVVGKEQTVEVVFSSGLSEKATVVMKGTIPLDIAILEIYGHRSDYDYLELGDSNDCAEGTDVIAIGSPITIKYSDTVTKGIISNCKRDELGVHYLQTDTPINPGNSGGPLIDSNGKVIAINTLGIGDLDAGLNLSIAINMVKDFMSWKLSYLEEKFRSEREEKITKLVKYFEEYWESELSKYKFRISLRLYRTTDKSRLSFSQQLEVDRIAQPKQSLPDGFNSWKKWFKAMAEGVIDKDITIEQVINSIIIHFSSG